MRPTRRSLLAGGSALALTPVLGALLAACGGASEADPATGTGAAASAGQVEDGAFPVTLTHRYGSTTITEAPARIVVVGLLEQDTLLALGLLPVATSRFVGDDPGAVHPWATAAYTDAGGTDAAGLTVLDPTDGIPVEEVVGLRPDLVIGLYSGMTQQEYDLLSKIAPTLAPSADHPAYGQPWNEATEQVGQAVGRPQAARDLVADVQQQVADAAAAHPQWASMTAVCVTPYEGLFVYGPDDTRGRFLGELGFTFPETLADPGSSDFGWSFSAERTSDLAGLDAVVWLDYDVAPAGITSLFEATDTAREGRYVDINDGAGAYYDALSFVTPLSIPWLLERYVAQLEAITDGRATTKPPTYGA